MRKLHLIILTVAAVSGAAVAGTLAGRWASDPEPAEPKPVMPLEVDAAALDVGEVWEDSRFEWSVPVTNRSAGVLHLQRWQASCDCLGIEPAATDFQPGETKTAKVRVNLTKWLDPKSSGPHPLGAAKFSWGQTASVQ